MTTFAIFIIAVAVYVTFLLWCLSPLVRRPQWRWFGWLRVAFALMLLGAHFVPPLAWPIAIPLAKLNEQAADRFMTVALFAWTFPDYILNLWDRATTSAAIVEISYPIEIGGVRYTPVVRTACTKRRVTAIDKYIELHFFRQFPTARGGDFSARAGNAVITLDQSPNLCSDVQMGRLQPGPLPEFLKISYVPRIYVIRGEADNTQIYELVLYSGDVAVEDVALRRPTITRVEQQPAGDIFDLDALWPMELPGDRYHQPRMIEAYRYLPVGPCVHFITAYIDRRTMTLAVDHGHGSYSREVPAAQRSAACKDAFAPRVPPPSMPPLTAAGG